MNGLEVEIECLDALPAWQRIAAEWDALVEQLPEPGLVLTHAWLTGAWRFLAPGRELRVLLARRRGELVGALALAVEPVRWRGRILRTLVLLTDPLTLNIRSDLLVRPGCAAAVLAAVAGYLRASRGDWTQLRFDSVPAASPLRAGWADFAAGVGLRNAGDELHWRLQRLPLAGSWEQQLASHSRNSLHQFRKEARRIESLGAIEVEVATAPAAVAAALEAFFELEQRSGKLRRADYTPLGPALRDYYRSQFAGLARAGCAVVLLIRHDGRPIACDLAGRLGDRVITFNELSDEAYRDHRIGHFMRARLVRWAADSGARELDFNGYGAHFERWRGVADDYHRLSGFSPSAAGRMLALHRRLVVPIARRVLPAGWLPRPAPERPGDRGLPADA